ncbi:hypothetical protein I2F29_10660 [Acinetobacter sp. FNA3]|nr:hypothetical protein [Acinetobacter pollinis]MBF7690966.1 hypothetical protein [Acinetobacter pollinis]MBF7693858.1 hypothetical protein [Acinetobacter pollinis]MBF7698663.1 hypothetical protein [Acinetobacter pollinis]MBF7701445.1 hypothetical protein [Acinetobacter pollinis]
MNMQKNRPETITVEDKIFGSHVEHWNLLTNNPSEIVPQWLGQALNAPVMPMGLCGTEQDMDESCWLIQGPEESKIQVTQVIAVENNQPKSVKTAFPIFESPFKTVAKVERIIRSQNNSQAVLRLNIGHNATVYAFDSLYAVNHAQYDTTQTYSVSLTAWAYELNTVNPNEHIVVDDPASIKHHRALNDILAEHNGIAPSNLQELIDQWQPKTEDDKAPVTVDFSKMVAYLYGENLGQEDEAWFQGKIVGKSELSFMNEDYTLYDVTLILEDNAESTLIRIITKDTLYKNYEIGEYIRGNIWIQANIYSTIKSK